MLIPNTVFQIAPWRDSESDVTRICGEQ